MRFVFKTSYIQDIQIFRDRVDRGWYILLALAVIAVPFVMSDYYVGESAWVFIYGICGVSLMVLVGYTGLVSLGHAAFLGIGAYAHAYFLQHGVPWVVSVALAVAITTVCGFIVGLPALRMTGIYLAIATLAFSIILQEVFTRWEAVTHGFAGMPVAAPQIFGFSFAGERPFYYLCLFFLVLVLWLTRNLLRAPTGRACRVVTVPRHHVRERGLHADRGRLLRNPIRHHVVVHATVIPIHQGHIRTHEHFLPTQPINGDDENIPRRRSRCASRGTGCDSWARS